MDCYLNEIKNDVICQNGMNSSIILNVVISDVYISVNVPDFINKQFNLSWDVYKSLNCRLKIKNNYKRNCYIMN